MKRQIRLILTVAMLIMLPMKYYGQAPQLASQQTTIDFDITDISLFDERVFFMYNLVNDCRFNVVNGESDGVFIVSADPAFGGMDLGNAFADFREQNAIQFSKMDKEQASELAKEYKATLPKEVTLSLMMDVYVKSRQNNHCADADPFCTDNGMYQFPAGVNAGSGETGPNYDCLSTTPNPAWYYMRIGNPGSINIYMYSTPSEDIDFCCWGPFDDPISPCPYGLTIQKKVSCSYSSNPTETCVIPSNAQTGQYYILVITNYSNHSCNINFSKTSGNGTTDCGILPPLVDNDGPYCVGETITLTGNAQQGANYTWSGPGGWTATGQTVTRPNCTMAMAGDYTCTIQVGTQTNSAPTHVDVYALPTANFSAPAVCQGNNMRFNNTSTTNPSGQAMSYEWNFGDGNTSTEQNPSHLYASAGNYNVSLTVSCGHGACSNTKTQSVTVYPNPVANAGEDQTVIYNGTATLRGTGGGSGNFNYHWEPANKVVNPNSQTTQTVALQQSTTFTLTVTHPQGGCSSSDQVSVLVSGSNMTATASASPSSVCQGQSSQLHASAVGGTGNYTYSWSPAIGLSSPIVADPIATPNETTTYTCTVSDGMGSQSVSTTVTVNNPEYEEVEQYICPGDVFTFYGQDYSEEGDYHYYTTTAQGCEKVITLHLHHYPSYPNAHTTTEHICYGTSYNFHGHYYNSDGLYSENLETVHGCDSIVWLDLTVYPENPVIVDNRSICSSQTLTWLDGNVYNQDGDEAFYDSIDNHGCLQVYQLHLTVGDYQTPENYDPRHYICVPYDGEPFYHWSIADRDYTQNTQDTIIISNPDPNGCDYEYILDLQFHREFHEEQSVIECDSYTWDIDHNTYDRSGRYTYTFEDVVGPGFVCEGEYVLNLTINESEAQHDSFTGCNEYSWVYGLNHDTITYYESNHYEQITSTAQGCQLVSTLDLQLDYSPDFPRVEGEAWVVGGSEFQYTIQPYWIDIHPGSSHVTEWGLYKPDGTPFTKWDLLPYENGDKCYLYIYTFELDTIELRAHTHSTAICDCGDFTHSKWIHCSSIDVNEIPLLCEAEIYPNPNDGDMTLSFDNMMGEVVVKVYDITGTLVDQFTVYNGYGHQTHRYQPDRLSKGVYFFNLSGKDGMLTKKVIIID